MTPPASQPHQGSSTPRQRTTQSDEGAATPSTPDTPQSHTPGRLSIAQLTERDRKAVAYSKASLRQGDTLVYITHPNGIELFDSTGFKLSSSGAPRLVHSEKLLATGSKKFKRIFSERSQAKLKRLKGYSEGMPHGIEYIADLTPPDEGDEAVDLTSELSCSLGIRHWYSAEERCRVPADVCGGKDEIAKVKGKTLFDELESKRENTARNNIVDKKTDNGYSSPTGSPAKDKSEWKKRAFLGLQDDWGDKNAQQSNTISTKRKGAYESVDDIPEYCPNRHRAGIERLMQIIEGKEPRLDSAPKVWTLFVLAKYFDCPAVVVSLRQFPSCSLTRTNFAQIDFIATWVLTEPNCRFIEILPEATLRMGLGLESAILTRPAFAILVSEYALSTIAKVRGSLNEGRSQFGRLREDIDEDVLGAIQEAANSFMSRVEGVLESLCDDQMAWFDNLPEYKKIKSFLEWAESCDAIQDRRGSIKESITQLKSGLNHFVRGRILLCFCADLSPRDQSSFNNNRHAEAYLEECKDNPSKTFYYPMALKEKMMTRFPWKALMGLTFGYGAISNALYDCNAASVEQRKINEDTAKLGAVQQIGISELFTYQTAFNQSVMDGIRRYGYNLGKFPEECYLPRVCGSETIKSVFSTDRSGCTRAPTKPPSGQDLTTQPSPKDGENVQFSLPLRPKSTEAEKVPIMDKKLDHNDSFSAAAARDNIAKETKSTITARISNAIGLSSHPPDNQQASADPRAQAIALHNQNIPTNGATLSTTFHADDLMWRPVLPHNATFTLPQLSVPHVPDGVAVEHESPFFSLQLFTDQVHAEVQRVAQMMLQNPSDLDFITLTDTLLCLNDSEFKYLPLWAGGNDDGTGGVFAPMIPPAPAGVGPSGPGPAFHTAFSMPSHEGSIEADFQDGLGTIYESVETSVVVDDGYSDHFHRHHVISEDEGDFRSETWSEDTEEYVGKGKGRATIHVEAERNYVEKAKKEAAMDTNASQPSAEPEHFTSPKPETPVEDDTEDHTALHVNSSSKPTHEPAPERLTKPKLDTLVEDEEEWNDSDEEEAFDFGEDVKNEYDDAAAMF